MHVEPASFGLLVFFVLSGLHTTNYWQTGVGKPTFACVNDITTVRKLLTRNRTCLFSPTRLPTVTCSLTCEGCFTDYYRSQATVDKGFFQPASRTVGFSLRFKNSDHLNFAALRFQKYWSCHAILLLPRLLNKEKVYPQPQVEAMLAAKTGQSYLYIWFLCG